MDQFHDNLLQFGTQNLKICTVKKYHIRNETDAEFSFALNQISKQTSESVLEEVLDRLKGVSKSWYLQISHTCITNERAVIKLNRQFAFRAVLRDILDQKTDYGKCPTKQQKIIITASLPKDKNNLDLTEKRIAIVKDTSVRILSALGYGVKYTEEEVDKRWNKNALQIHFSTSNVNIANKKTILCGVVVNSKHGSKECAIMANDFKSLCMNQIKLMSEHKYWDNSNQDTLAIVADASVIIELLKTGTNKAVRINVDATNTSKGAPFVLYNTARVSSILQQFGTRISSGGYPALLPFEDINIDLLKEPEEWQMLFNYLLEYPSVLKRTSEKIEDGVFSPQYLCNFLFGFCSLFSVYYRRVRILMEGKEHFIPGVFAKIYFLQAIHQVLENSLAMLNITKIDHM